MADREELSKTARIQSAVILDRNRVQIEFVIDDLVKELAKGGISPVAACNGCNSCSQADSLVQKRK